MDCRSRILKDIVSSNTTALTILRNDLNLNETRIRKHINWTMLRFNKMIQNAQQTIVRYSTPLFRDICIPGEGGTQLKLLDALGKEFLVPLHLASSFDVCCQYQI